ncbi:hypothetical protein HNY73_021492 [Argiope bruennichi]|uniref:Uncharacterized protein n=1 Tax=Argiope bruennichi TaxID=94029 RepID=A0A8T0DXT7_ARGBR|nr:hypothetical protein HNY73_021492 [Argiope bruennichi]
MLAVKADVSVGRVWTIVHDRLSYRKVCAQWVPKQLIDQLKELRMGLALEHLFLHHQNLTFLERIVTGDENLWHHYKDKDKRQSRTAYSGSICQHLHLKSSTPWRQQAICCSPSFSMSKIQGLYQEKVVCENITLATTAVSLGYRVWITNSSGTFCFLSTSDMKFRLEIVGEETSLRDHPTTLK